MSTFAMFMLLYCHDSDMLALKALLSTSSCLTFNTILSTNHIVIFAVVLSRYSQKNVCNDSTSLVR